MNDFYQDHLNRVSRSFAFCIERLNNPLREWISCSYLLCRVLDTIEDSPWRTWVEQGQEFDLFQKALVGKAQIPDLWFLRFSEQISEGEKALLKDAPILFSKFAMFPEKVQSAIRPNVFEMSEGMRYYSRRIRKTPLRSLDELEDYCFYVAGLVGGILTRLISVADGEASTKMSSLLPVSYQFGTFLQKINILKDERVDTEKGRIFISDRAALISSLRQDATAAFEYLIQLPKQLKSFKLFCAWSLFLGLFTLPLLQNASVTEDLKTNEVLKIPRKQAMELYSFLDQIVDDEHRLSGFFRDLVATLPKESAAYGPIDEFRLFDSHVD